MAFKICVLTGGDNVFLGGGRLTESYLSLWVWQRGESHRSGGDIYAEEAIS